MLHKSSIKYKEKSKGTTLFARFEYTGEVRLKVDTKEAIQERLGLGEEFKKYLGTVEGLKLNAPFFACDGNGLGRYVGFSPNKRKLTLKVDITTNQQISQEKMLNLDALDLFLARGQYPENKGNYRKI